MERIEQMAIRENRESRKRREKDKKPPSEESHLILNRTLIR
jgi:hypothetical protein